MCAKVAFSICVRNYLMFVSVTVRARSADGLSQTVMFVCVTVRARSADGLSKRSGESETSRDGGRTYDGRGVCAAL